MSGQLEDKKYRVRCAGCGRVLTVHGGPGQRPCQCGSRLGFYRSPVTGREHVVGWIYNEPPRAAEEVSAK